MEKKVLILSYYWPPSGGPGVQRWLKFVKYLPELGYEPFVVVPDPQKATYPIIDHELVKEVNPHAKVFTTSTREPYSLYKRLMRKKQVPYSGFTNDEQTGFFTSLSRFIRGNFFVPDARKGWNHFARKKAAELILQHSISTLITTGPPHSTHLTGLSLQKMFPHIRWIADLRDPWTDIFYYDKMLHLPCTKKTDRRLEVKVLERADKIITVSDHLKKLFDSKLNRTDSKVDVIHNGYDHEDFGDIRTDKNDPFFTITYAGTLSGDYPLEGLLDALQGLKNKKIRFVFAGNVSDFWIKKLKAVFRGEVIQTGHVDHHKAIKYMEAADVLLLVIPRIAQNEGIVTGKLFEYLAARRPVLGIGPANGDAASILKKTGCGTMFDYQDKKGIETFIQQFFHEPALWQPDTEEINRFSRKSLTEKLAEVIAGKR